MVSKAVSAFLNQALTGEEIKTPLEHIHRGLTVEELNTTVILAPTSGILKDIFAKRFNLNPERNFVYVLPPELMINGKGFNALEFPIYYGAYIQGNLSKDKPLEVVCTKEQKEYMLNFLERTIMGPNWDDPAVYPSVQGDRRDFFRNIAKFQSPKDENGNVIPLSSYISFHTFGEDGKARISNGADKGNLVIEQMHNRQGEVAGYEVIHEKIREGEDLSSSSLLVNYVIPEEPLIPISQSDKEAIQHNRYNFLSVTCFGNSTGFDPNGYNTSFIVWMGGKGVIIDPSTRMLQALDVLGLTEDDCPFIVLTHCHEDHDSGVLELIKRGKKFNLVASHLVHEELKLKTQSQMSNVDWIELPVDSTVKLDFKNGETGEVGGFDNIHPIPTSGLYFKYKGSSLGHSGDTVWGIHALDDYMQNGVISQKQAEEHANRWFDIQGKPKFDLLLFEAGGAPIHTVVDEIASSTSAEFKANVLLYHVPDAKVEKSDLRKIRLYETVCIEEANPKEYEAIKKNNHLYTILDHPYWAEISNSNNILEIATECNFESGRKIISRDDEPLKDLYIIVSGTASIRDSSNKEIARRGPGAIIGDWSHLTGVAPSSDVVAHSDITAYAINVRDLISDPNELMRVRNLAHFLKSNTATFSRAFEKYGFSLHDLTSTILELNSATERIEVAPHAILFAKGEESDVVYIIEKGSVELFEAKRHDDVIATKIKSVIKEGDIINQDPKLPNQISGRAGGNGAVVLAIQKSAFLELLERYPGLGDALRS